MELYHLSKTNMNDDRIAPRIPSNYFTKNGYEDGITPRVCFYSSIDGCLRGLSQKCNSMECYVHIPDGNYKTYKPSTREVPDCEITGELWITKPVDLKCIGKIKVIKDKGEDGIPFSYGSHTAELYDWEWKWIEKYNDNGENIIKESADYEWKSPEELSKWMKSNIKYGHSNNWKLRSPEEVINSKKGDCHDQSLLEYEVLKSLGYKAGRLFMVEYSSWNQPGGATHTACWYEKSNKYYWFENAWGGKEGIHGPYKSLDELKSAIADEWNWSGKNDKLYMGNCTGVKVGMDLGEYVSAVVPEKESSKVFHKNDLVHESYIVESIKMNGKDIYVNADKFESDKSNVLLITGLSGSGKSTLAADLAKKYKCENFELDCLDFYLGGYFSKERAKKYEPALYDFIEKKHLEQNKELAKNKLYKEYIKFIISWCKKNKDTKYIIEGLQIYEVYEDGDSFITSNPIIIKGTNALVSAIRGAKRNDGPFLKEFKDLIIWALEDSKQLNKLRDSLIINTESCIHEGTKSVIDPNFKPKGKMNLSSLKKVHITDSVINKYKKEYPFLNHVRCKDTDIYICDGYIWFDDDKLVAMVGSCEYRDDHTKWIVSLEITKDYKGYGLSKQILDYATKNMKCKYLSVNKDNNVAKKVYDEYGFKTYQQDKTMYYMTIDSNISSQENCSFLNVQDCMAEDDINMVNESYVFSKDDLYINFEDFESGKSNICIITGLSGSGKSTLANQVASKYNAEIIELDIFDSWWYDQLTRYELDRVNDIFKKWFSTHESGAHNRPRNELKYKDLGKDCSKFIHYCILECAKNKSKKYVIEGVQIYESIEYKEIKSYPLIIKNTSILKSIIQRWKRNGNGKIDLLAELSDGILSLVKWYAGEEKSLNSLRKAVIKESAILEEKRSEIPAKEFGVPSKRKFPLTDAKHVKSAIKFFNYVDEEDEAELARNIKRKAKEFGVVIRCGKQNRLSKYINKEYVNEFMAVSAIGNNMYAVNNGNIKQHIAQGDHIVSATDSYPYTKKEKRKKKDPVDGRISVYMGDGEKLSVNESAERVPIYIIAYDYSSVFALALKATTHSHYNHIAIALSPDLEHAYTFARSAKGDHNVKGFTEEPLSQMIKEHGNFYIKINAVYIPKDAYNKIRSMINDYKKHKDDTTYNYGNLVRGALGIKVDNDDLDSDNMNCSIFVDYMLKNVGVDITDNPNSNLVFPEHLANADIDHDNVVTVYYGNAKGYNKKKVSKMKFLGEDAIEEVKTPKKCSKCGSSNIGVFIKGEPVYICKDCGAYNGTVPFKESIDDDTFFDNLEKQFEDLDMEPIPTDIFNERKDQG